MADERNGAVLSEAEVRTRVLRRKIQTWGGLLVGLGGIGFAFTALLMFESVPLSTLGWGVTCVGFGLMYPDQVLRMMGVGKGASGGGA